MTDRFWWVKKKVKKYRIRDYGDVKKEHFEFVCENVYIWLNVKLIFGQVIKLNHCSFQNELIINCTIISNIHNQWQRNDYKWFLLNFIGYLIVKEHYYNISYINKIRNMWGRVLSWFISLGLGDLSVLLAGY